MYQASWNICCTKAWYAPHGSSEQNWWIAFLERRSHHIRFRIGYWTERDAPRILPAWHITLRRRFECEQDEVLAKLLRRLWRAPPKAHPFRHLSEMTASWSKESLDKADSWFDAGLVREGLCIFEELSNNAPSEVLLATDLHAGSVLQAQREPWLVIDPKPFVGDLTYDATQHLFNCDTRLRSDPERMIRHFADLLNVDHERVHLWLFACAVVGLSDGELVSALAP